MMLSLFSIAALFVGTQAVRNCTTQQFELRILDVRYDGPDPEKQNDLATIAIGLSTASTPLYECVAQWPEEWGGFYEASDAIIWADCIYTGAGLGPDNAVSFAVDWEKKTMYLGHTFECLDPIGYVPPSFALPPLLPYLTVSLSRLQGLAMGSLSLDLTCTAASGDNATACFARPSTVRINTTLSGFLTPGSPVCEGQSKTYQSWQLSYWHRQFVRHPGSPGPLENDTGPTFTLHNMVTGDPLECATAKTNSNGVFEGACGSSISNTTGGFSFDPKLDILKVNQSWACER